MSRLGGVAVIALAVLAVPNCGGGKDEPSRTEQVAAAPGMADWSGKPLTEAQAALDHIYEIKDVYGGINYTQREWDRAIPERVDPERSPADWVICRQFPEAGGEFNPRYTSVRLAVVLDGEECLSEEEQEARHQVEIDGLKARQAQRQAEWEVQRAEEQAARQAETDRVPVLDAPALSACQVLAAGWQDVTTKQDRSDFAQAFNVYARQSSEPKVVQAGESLTSSVDSWTGFMWDGSVAIAAEVCLTGGAR